ncbi:hypothetical protein TNCV_4759671 [Trichonephila clavipes]|nr:hypothetical protein TNCV_4759671 [Trichonephila clavipes]
MISLEQLRPVEQSADRASHLCILAFQSLHFVNKFLAATIVVNIFTQLYLYVAGDDLLLGMTIQLHAFRQCYHVRSPSVAYKVFEKVVMASFVFFSRESQRRKRKKDKKILPP